MLQSDLMERYLIKGRNDMQRFAGELLRRLQPSQNGATVLGLVGDLGSGKTTFTQGLAEALDVNEAITSPTFVIEKIYELEARAWKRLIHIDTYRLDSAQELLPLGWAELIQNPEHLIVVEWADRVSEILPPEIVKIYFKFIDEETREVSLA